MGFDTVEVYLVACFSGPSSLTFSAKSAILKLKGYENKIFILCLMFRKVISFIYEIIHFDDRVPLSLCLVVKSVPGIF